METDTGEGMKPKGPIIKPDGKEIGIDPALLNVPVIEGASIVTVGDNDVTSSEQTEGAEEPQRISPVARVESPAGVGFDILRHASHEAVVARGTALDEMRAVIEQEDPSLLQYIDTKGSTSAEYAMSRAIMKAKGLPELQAKLLRILVNSTIAEGRASRGLNELARTGGARLGIAGFDKTWASGLYDSAMQRGDVQEAWNIAEQLKDHGREILTPEPPHKRTPKIDWDTKAQEAFHMYVDQVLADPDADEMKLDLLFLSYRLNRTEGYDAPQPSERARQVALRLVKIYAQQDRPGQLQVTARTAKLSRADLGSVLDTLNVAKDISSLAQEPKPKATGLWGKIRSIFTGK